MRILFCDFIFQKGNAHVDTELVKSFVRNNKVTVMANHDRLTEKICGVDFVENKHYYRKKGTLKIYWGILRNMYLAAKYANSHKPDLVFISVYETRMFLLGRLFFKNKKNIVIMENANIDYLSQKSHLFFYKKYSNKVFHAVYEEYMKDYLVKEIAVPSERIFVVPHPCYNYSFQNAITQYDCIAISGSNDEDIIREFVQYENKTHRLKDAGIKVLIKSKNTKFDDGFLKVDNTYYSNEEYNSLYSSARVIFTPFPKTYKYRMSGCFVDSFSHKKPVISSPIMLAKYYEKKYPNIISTSDNMDSIFNGIIQYSKEGVKDETVFDDFLRMHSEKSLNESIDILLEGIQR
ncbi:MAG: hypothetical protein ILA24_03850 [Ruminococcus sp.]|nr:hypothetical protein [Ruminococcus sp.]